MDNVVNRFLLRVILWPSWLYRRLDVNMPQLKSILTTKLIMDDRRASGLQKARNERSGKETSTATLFVMFVSLLMGLLFLYAFSIEEDVTRLTLYFSFYVFMLSLSLIADFTHVLIDVKDNYIILPKPVSAKTFLIARLLHILIHVSKITVPMAVPGCIYILVDKGIWGLIYFIPAMILLTLFTIFLVNAVYLLILKIFTPEKFNSIISTVQIVFSIIIYGAFQILPRILDETTLNEVDISKIFAMWFYPPFWFAGAWKYLYAWYPSPTLIISLGLSILMPLFSIWVVIKYFAPAFHRKLSMISGAVADEKQKGEEIKVRNKPSSLLPGIAGLFTRSAIERGSFLLTWHLTSRFRDFKMKLYPQVGYILVLLVLFMYRRLRETNLAALKYDEQFKFPFILLIYLSSFVFMSAIFLLPYSDKFKASWIYQVTPSTTPGIMIRGAVMSCLVKFSLPVMLIVIVISLAVFGIAQIPNLLFGLANVLLLNAIISNMNMKQLPFSASPKNVNAGENFARNIMMMIFFPFLAVPHYFIYSYPIALSALSLVSFAGAYFLFRRLGQITWDEVKRNAD